MEAHFPQSQRFSVVFPSFRSTDGLNSWWHQHCHDWNSSRNRFENTPKCWQSRLSHHVFFYNIEKLIIIIVTKIKELPTIVRPQSLRRLGLEQEEPPGFSLSDLGNFSRNSVGCRHCVFSATLGVFSTLSGVRGSLHHSDVTRQIYKRVPW